MKTTEECRNTKRKEIERRNARSKNGIIDHGFVYDLSTYVTYVRMQKFQRHTDISIKFSTKVFHEIRNSKKKSLNPEGQAICSGVAERQRQRESLKLAHGSLKEVTWWGG